MPYSPFRAIRWAVLNFGAATCAFYGIYENIPWARNVFVFRTVVGAIISLGSFSDDLRKTCQEEGRSVPAVLSGSLDIAIVVACAGAGCFWLATGWLWMAIAEAMIFSKRGEQA